MVPTPLELPDPDGGPPTAPRRGFAHQRLDAYRMAVDLVRGVDRKPLPSLEGLRNVQRLLRLRTPKVGDLKLEDVIDARIARRLDESGFIEKTFAAHGASLK